MLENLLTKLAIGEELDPTDPHHRTRMGTATGIFGIFLNLTLTAFKLIVGTVAGSVSIVADGINNLSDTLASIVTTAGIIFSGMPSDREHPYGHGRLEYLIALVISIGVFLVGGIIFKNSILGIIDPPEIEFSILAIVILIFSIIIKLLMYRTYTSIGEKLDSSPLRAASLDSIGDVGITLVVLLSYLGSVFTRFPIDGIGSLIVSLAILKGGYEMIREMVSQLLGERIDPEIKAGILKSFEREDILDTHDLYFHNYGPGAYYATIDAVVDSDLTVDQVYKLFNIIEYQVLKDLGVNLTVRMDIHPPSTDVELLCDRLQGFIEKRDYILAIHDEQVFEENGQTNIILNFDVDGEIVQTLEDKNKLEEELTEHLSKYYKSPKITMLLDRLYDNK